MSLIFQLEGDDVSCGSIRLTGARASICKMARSLVALGRDPDAEVRIFRGDTECFKPAPLSAWADLTVIENDRQSARLAQYKPMPAGLHK